MDRQLRCADCESAIDFPWGPVDSDLNIVDADIEKYHLVDMSQSILDSVFAGRRKQFQAHNQHIEINNLSKFQSI